TGEMFEDLGDANPPRVSGDVIAGVESRGDYRLHRRRVRRLIAMASVTAVCGALAVVGLVPASGQARRVRVGGETTTVAGRTVPPTAASARRVSTTTIMSGPAPSSQTLGPSPKGASPVPTIPSSGPTINPETPTTIATTPTTGAPAPRATTFSSLAV